MRRGKANRDLSGSGPACPSSPSRAREGCHLRRDRPEDPIGWLFAYGSLVADAGEQRAVAVLHDHERWWGTAMDNREAIAGYKRYLDPATGEPPHVAVAFLDLSQRPGSTVEGVVLPADEAALTRYDGRERNYERVEVTGAVTGEDGERLEGPVITYAGSAAGRRRRHTALAEDRLVVHRGYRDLVRAGYARLGRGALSRFDASTAPVPCSIVALRRVER